VDRSHGPAPGRSPGWCRSAGRHRRVRRNFVDPQVTYNLTVASLHTYYVEAGNTPVLVHNEEEGCSDNALEVARHALARSQDGSADSVDHIIPGVDATVSAYASYADSVMDRTGVEFGYRASSDSMAYWDSKKGVIIIISTDGSSTMFIPRGGYSYFKDNFTSLGTVG